MTKIKKLLESGTKYQALFVVPFYMVETCAKRQPVPLKNDNPRIQDQDYWVIILNARRLTAFCPTLIFS